jgi:hypothetical protein
MFSSSSSSNSTNARRTTFYSREFYFLVFFSAFFAAIFSAVLAFYPFWACLTFLAFSVFFGNFPAFWSIFPRFRVHSFFRVLFDFFHVSASAVKARSRIFCSRTFDHIPRC